MMKFSIIHVVLCALLLRWQVSRFPHSGEGKPPMFGDFEAQRHWMEITVNLPVTNWYVNGSDNDLQYWGLDYPPLTAYHSYICGLVGRWINPKIVRLHESRGSETYDTKLFMRYTVFVSDLLLYFPAVLLFHQFKFQNLKSLWKITASVASVSLFLFYPGLILIDYGHFQYNCVSLGFVVLAVSALFREQDILASFCFCLALNFKQMELFHAVPFFFYLLAKCFEKKSFLAKFWHLAKIGSVVVLTFVIIWLPFLHSLDIFAQVLNRLFPFDRGLYEDKVANFWCSISVIVKIKEIFPPSVLSKICAAVTGLLVLPSGIHLFFRPSVQNLILALVNSSLIFFLFGFHIHEKSILIAALPVSLLLSDQPLPSIWFLLTSSFSMLPLFIKDDLTVPYVATMILYLILAYHFTSFSMHPLYSQKFSSTSISFFTKLTFTMSLLGMLILTILSLTISPPPRYPDLFPVLISIYSCGHFTLFTIYFHYEQFRLKNDARVKKKKQH